MKRKSSAGCLDDRQRRAHAATWPIQITATERIRAQQLVVFLIRQGAAAKADHAARHVADDCGHGLDRLVHLNRDVPLDLAYLAAKTGRE